MKHKEVIDIGNSEENTDWIKIANRAAQQREIRVHDELARKELEKAISEAQPWVVSTVPTSTKALRRTPEERYQRAIINSTAALWRGTVSIFEFVNALTFVIDAALTESAKEGLSQCGLLLEELSSQDQAAIQDRINQEFLHLPGYAEYIVEHSKANGHLLRSLMPRASLWWGQYQHLRELGKSLACADQKAMWVYGPTIEHCRDCANVVGRVYKFSTWNRYGWVPGSPELACNGIKCQCKREVTSAPITPGRPPNIQGPE